jgi:hypothetical protein
MLFRIEMDSMGGGEKKKDQRNDEWSESPVYKEPVESKAGLTRSTTYKLQSPPSSTLSGFADSGLKGMTADEALALGSYLVPPLPSLPPPPPTPPLFRRSLSAMTLLNSLTRSLGGQLAPWMTVWSSSSRACTRRVQTRETR